MIKMGYGKQPQITHSLYKKTVLEKNEYLRFLKFEN